jgi:thiaminase/transcriptional activator TenA
MKNEKKKKEIPIIDEEILKKQEEARALRKEKKKEKLEFYNEADHRKEYQKNAAIEVVANLNKKKPWYKKPYYQSIIIGIIAFLIVFHLANEKPKTTEFSEYAINNVTKIIDSMKNHKFVKELIKGNLDIKKFEYYINQRALYLNSFENNIENLDKKIWDSDTKKFFLNKGIEAKELKNFIINDLSKELKLKIDMNDKKFSKTTKSYIEYQYSNIFVRGVDEGITSILPYYWLNDIVGSYIKKNIAKNNKYKSWINKYNSNPMSKDSKNIINILNENVKLKPDKISSLTKIFIQISQLEFNMLDEAYNLNNK